LNRPKDFGVFDYLNSVFDRTVHEIISAEQAFQDCDPYKSNLTEEQLEILRSHHEALKKALKNITNPL
tara:strand:+ start:5190 stop:5393 length:204 start_codon:yes stop_codon:yes gene_type:complete